MKIIEQKDNNLVVELEVDFNCEYEPIVRIANDFFDGDIEYTLKMVFEKGCDYYIDS